MATVAFLSRTGGMNHGLTADFATWPLPGGIQFIAHDRGLFVFHQVVQPLVVHHQNAGAEHLVVILRIDVE